MSDKKKFILIQFNGGLGNQMFQYAFARRLSIEYHLALKSDTTLADSHRNFQLNIFSLPVIAASAEDFKHYDRRSLNYLQKFWFRVNHLFEKNMIVTEEVYYKNRQVADNVDSIYLKGYFQNEEFFKTIEPIIRNDFSFPILEIKELQPIAERLRDSNSVGIHVRRGDYLIPKINDIHGVLPVSYYNQAIDLIRSKISNPKFFIFSDDIVWCQNFFKGENDIFFPTAGVDYPNHIDMQLMSLCKHNIIANSSYSWWAAWLNCQNEKIVIAPNKWFQSTVLNEQHKNIVPSTWLKI